MPQQQYDGRTAPLVDVLDGGAHVPIVKLMDAATGAAAGGATEATLLQVRDAIEAQAVTAPGATEATLLQVRDAIKAQASIASTLWTDNSGSYYVRRDVIHPDTGTVAVTFCAPDGSAAVPGAGLRPLSSADRDVAEALFDATGAGTGYAAGDVLARVLIIDVTQSTPSVTAIWVNLGTGAVIAAPAQGTYESANETVSVRQSGVWSVSVSSLPATAATEATLASVLTKLSAQLGVFATSSGNLAPYTLTSMSTALSAQSCKRACLISPTQDALITQGGNDFYLVAGVPQWVEGISNTNALSVRFVTAAGTLYVHWES